MLYMGNEFDNLFKPILEKQLKPGTRIVSHRFVLGDWAPDKTHHRDRRRTATSTSSTSGR